MIVPCFPSTQPTMSTPTSVPTQTQTQADRAAAFHRLHVKGTPLVLFNVWDAGSAKVVAEAGARAIATGSWSVAAAQGYGDGQQLPLAVALENLVRIVASVSLPVTIDLEAGYGDAPAAVADAVTHAINAGAIGFNIEDQIVGGSGLYSVADQSARLHAARLAADRVAMPAFINARTDIFLKAKADQHSNALIDEALQRAAAYAAAGASGFFAPGLIDPTLIERLCAACPLPVNIMVMPAVPSATELAKRGVARISHGPGPYRHMMRTLDEAARLVYLV
jgi:2-methylisocitrate lyase-like PEP mutase family enzyme